MFFRIALLLAVVVAVVLVMRRARRAVERGRKRPVIEAKMAQCPHCGTYFPREEAVSAGGREYCSSAHAREAGHS